MARKLIAAMAFVLVAGVVVGAAATLQVGGGTIQYFEDEVTVEVQEDLRAPAVGVEISSADACAEVAPAAEQATATPVPFPTATEVTADLSFSWQGSQLEVLEASWNCEKGGMLSALVANGGEGRMAAGVAWEMHCVADGSPPDAAAVVAHGEIPVLEVGQMFRVAGEAACGTGEYAFWVYQETGYPGGAVVWSDAVLVDQALCYDESQVEGSPPPTDTPDAKQGSQLVLLDASWNCDNGGAVSALVANAGEGRMAASVSWELRCTPADGSRDVAAVVAKGEIPALDAGQMTLISGATGCGSGEYVFWLDQHPGGSGDAALASQAVRVDQALCGTESSAPSTPEATDEPGAEPTCNPSDPIGQPTPRPTEDPCPDPTDEPTAEPGEEQAPDATAEPTAEPSEDPPPDTTPDATADSTEEPPPS